MRTWKALAIACLLAVALLTVPGTDAGTLTYSEFESGVFIFTDLNDHGEVELARELDLTWTSVGANNTGAMFGYSVASAGDVNGDGYEDVIVGAYIDHPSAYPGRAYLYEGSAHGLGKTDSWNSSGDGYTDGYFGRSVAGAGDVNGDGYDDVIVGCPRHNGTNGKAYIYLGSPNGLRSEAIWTSLGDDVELSYFGERVAGVGDVNGDGFDDWVVGAQYYDTTNTNAGKVYLFLGSDEIDGTTWSWSSSGDDQDGAYYGSSVSGAGDVNADGYDDWIVGAYQHDTGYSNSGKAFLYLGSGSVGTTTPSWTSSGDKKFEAYFGYSVSGAGDVNGDGFDDWLVGAYGYEKGGGKAYLYLGSSSIGGTSESWSSIGGEYQQYAYYGYTTAGAGDLNGDGYDDWAVQAYGHSTDNTDAGRVYVYAGSPAGPSEKPIWTSVGDDQADAHFGTGLAFAGDIDADGLEEIIIGADHYSNGENEVGKTYVYSFHEGVGTGVPAWEGAGFDPNGDYGRSCDAAGDVNGDGYDDWIVGQNGYDLNDINSSDQNVGRALLYLGGRTGLSTTPAWSSSGDEWMDAYFGFTVAGAGDVNGDGFDDWLVGAPGYNSNDTGKVYLYLGSSNVAGTAANWTSVGEEYELANSAFGMAVAGAGDVNGDGYDDWMVGQPLFDFPSHERIGLVQVFLGSSNVSGTERGWLDTGPWWDCRFGNSVSGAGDVNGDGYDDWIVGAEEFNTTSNSSGDETGAAFLYLGSRDLVAYTPSWSSSGYEQAEAHYGGSVSAAGDVNGDGFDDWIVGATDHDLEGTDEGIAYLYLGSPNVDKTVHSWTSSGDEQQDSHFGSVSGIGDVNGDGYSDWMVGAHAFDSGDGTGKVHVYLGSVDPSAELPAWTVTGGEFGTGRFGYAISAGDINGNGLDDLLASAYSTSIHASGAGTAYAFLSRGALEQGAYLSEPFSSEGEVKWTGISWTPGDLPAGSTLLFQIGSSYDGINWEYSGPDGTADTFYTNAMGETVRSGQTGRFWRFRAVFERTTLALSPKFDSVTIDYVEYEEPTVTLHSPNGGEDLMESGSHIVTWTADGDLNGTPIQVFYSTDGGTTWSQDGSWMANTGHYNWSVPSVETATGLVRITVTDIYGNTISDVSDMTFAIDPPANWQLPGSGSGDSTNDGTDGSDTIGTPDQTSTGDGAEMGTLWMVVLGEAVAMALLTVVLAVMFIRKWKE